MTDDPLDDRTVIKLPTARPDDAVDSLTRLYEEQHREKMDAMFARMERGEISEEEMLWLKNDAARRAFGKWKPPLPGSIPDHFQPAVREALEKTEPSQ